MVCVVLFRLFFFFQAEDGIRDRDVNWSSDVCSSDLIRFYLDNLHHPSPSSTVLLSSSRDKIESGFQPARERGQQIGGTIQVRERHHLIRTVRSEERRVGKECRSRGSAYREK